LRDQRRRKRERMRHHHVDVVGGRGERIVILTHGRNDEPGDQRLGTFDGVDQPRYERVILGIDLRADRMKWKAQRFDERTVEVRHCEPRLVTARFERERQSNIRIHIAVRPPTRDEYLHDGISAA
jgi:hypothetical protein